jgi:hypothetical protein
MREEVLQYRRVIGKYLGRYGLLSSREAAELAEAYEAVRQIQDRCFHEFQSTPLFTSNGWICEYCGFTRLTPEEEERESA